MLLLIIRNTKTVLTRLDKVWDRIEQSPKVVGPLLCNGDRPRALDLCLWRKRSALVVHLPIAATQSVNTRNKINTTHVISRSQKKGSVYIEYTHYAVVRWWWLVCDYVCIYLLRKFWNIRRSQLVSIQSPCHWDDGGGHGDEAEASQR